LDQKSRACFRFEKEQMSKPEQKVVAIIPAAGAGVRMARKEAKQFLEIHGKPMLALTLERFQLSPVIHAIVAVVPAGQVDFCRTDVVERYGLTKVAKVIAGGKRRQDSVRLGIEASEGLCEIVLIHDGVRPFIDEPFIDRVVTAATRHRAVTAALPAKETVKEVDERGFVVKTHDRKSLWMVQTPQAFRYEDILEAHRVAFEQGWEEVTDDALLIEKMGIPIKVIEGSESNLKITTPLDLELADFLLKKAKSFGRATT
jgi:2-C-methyl-D-erythritol 4-phosphate cytidylyltransferase